jgi:hypothetical protein
MIAEQGHVDKINIITDRMEKANAEIDLVE